MGKLKLRPLGDRLVVEPLEAVEKTKGGIILPDTAKEKPQEGKVVAVGKGKTDENGKPMAMEVKVGDKILYGKYAGTEITIDNVEYMILREEDVLAVVDEK
ncbi:MAG TPA: co-chaperone GroES [bacterium]|nr:co-chaperone GroES [bacterium]